MVVLDRNGAVRRVNDARRMLAGHSDVAGAEAAFRDAIGMDPQSVDAATGLAELVRHLGRPEESLTILAPFLAMRQADHSVLAEAAEAQKALGAPEAALALYRRAAKDFPTSAVASHNLAGVLGDLSQFEEAQTRARKAIASGLEAAPQPWLVLARALQGLGRLDESESAFRKVLDLDRLNTDAWRELTQLVWMRTGSMDAALAPLDAMLKTQGPNARLLENRALALKFCGDIAGARETLLTATRLYPSDAPLQVFAAHLAILAERPAEGLVHAEAAVNLAPGFWTKLALCEALLACGDAVGAADRIQDLRRIAPNDQNVIAYQATAWRLLGDDRYAELYDYERFVSTQSLDTPKGWTRLETYLSDLAVALEALHSHYRANPFQQSVEKGSQVSNLIASPDPVIRAFFEALKEPILQRVRALGSGADPLRSRNTFDTRLQGVWSVRLQGSGGRHVGHVHSKGWLSSACYISLPDSVVTSTRQEGWLKFGQPGIATIPPLAAEHSVRPEPGLLALFPSYMWHGTEMFTGNDARLSVAFDLLPR